MKSVTEKLIVKKKKVGRKKRPKRGDTPAVSVRLSKDHVKIAKKYGKGSLSEGIRKGLELLKEVGNGK